MESRLYKSKNNHVRGQGSNPRSTGKKIGGTNFIVSFFSHLVIYCANVWNEKEADKAHKRRDFEDDKVKSHIRLSSAQPFNCRCNCTQYTFSS